MALTPDEALFQMHMKMTRAILALWAAVSELELKHRSPEAREQLAEMQKYISELLTLAEEFRKDG